MSPTEILPRFVISITGPGDPIWHGGPDRDRARRLRAIVEHDSRGRSYYRLGTQLRRLKTDPDLRDLNAILDGQ
jgi:hypothetical protein